MIVEVFSNLNDSLLLFFWGIQLLMGFRVVCRVFEEKSSSCHCHGKGGESGEPHRVTPSCSMEQISDRFGYYNCIPGMAHAKGDDIAIPSPQRGILLPLNSPWLQSFIWPWRAVVTSFFMCKGNMKLAGFQQTLVLSGACVVYIKLQNTFRTNSPQQAKLF